MLVPITLHLLEQTFPDMIGEVCLRPDQSDVIEYLVDDEGHISWHTVRMQVIRDGVWAGCSEKSKIVYLYQESD